MLSCMGRIRVYFDADEALRLAIRHAALRSGKTASSLIEAILSREFATELAAAQREIENRSEPATKSTRGRKPKRPAD